MGQLGRPLVWGEVMGNGSQTFTLPVGTVTFLLADVEGSTKSWEAAPAGMEQAMPILYDLRQTTTALAADIPGFIAAVHAGDPLAEAQSVAVRAFGAPSCDLT